MLANDWDLMGKIVLTTDQTKKCYFFNTCVIIELNCMTFSPHTYYMCIIRKKEGTLLSRKAGAREEKHWRKNRIKRLPGSLRINVSVATVVGVLIPENTGANLNLR